MGRVLNFGSLNLDYVYSVDHFVKPGETMSAKTQKINPGGKGLNQSCALARAGADVFHPAHWPERERMCFMPAVSAGEEKL